MPTETELVTTAKLPAEVYYILGIIIITNLGTIVTIIGAAFRVVWKFAVLTTKVDALHRRVDDLEDRRKRADNECESDE